MGRQTLNKPFRSGADREAHVNVPASMAWGASRSEVEDNYNRLRSQYLQAIRDSKAKVIPLSWWSRLSDGVKHIAECTAVGLVGAVIVFAVFAVTVAFFVSVGKP